MKRNTVWLLAAALLAAQTTFAGASPVVEWEKPLQPEGVWASCVVQTSDGGFVVAGGVRPASNACFYLLRLDSAGNTEWGREYGGTPYGNAWSVQQTSDSGYVLAGTSYQTSEDSVVVIKTNSDGCEQWRSSSVHWYTAGEVRQTSDGGYIIAGHNGLDSILLLKLNSAGNEVWRKAFKVKVRKLYMTHTPVGQCSDGGFVTAADELIRIDAAGNVRWRRKYDRVWSLASVIQTADGGIAATGVGGTLTVRNWCNICLIKTDSLGNLQWKKLFTRGVKSDGRSVRQTANGGYFICATDSVGVVIRTDSQGDLLWTNVVRDGYWPALSGQQTSDGGFIILLHRRLVKLAAESQW